MKKALKYISVILCMAILLGCFSIYAEGAFDKMKADYLAYLIDKDSKNSKYTVDDILIIADYGNHSGYDIVVMGVIDRLHSPMVGSMDIAGITFTFGYADDMSAFYAYKDGSFISVKDAYDSGLLNKTDIYNIAVTRGDIVLPKYEEYWSDGNITLVYEETTATMYVSGKGRTEDYEFPFIGGLGYPMNLSPVFANSAIKHVVVEEGITYLGEYFFDDCYNIETIELPGTLEEIGDHCFEDCRLVSSIVFPEGIKRIGYCFRYGCIDTITFCGNLPKMQGSRSDLIPGMASGTVYYPKDNPTWSEDVMKKYGSGITWVPWDAPDIKDITNRFDDVSKNAWYNDAVQYVYDGGMMVGTSFTSFAPNAAMTRAQTVQILFNLSGESKENYTGKSYFKDVSKNAWYTPAINWAYENRITSGVGFGMFAPNQLVTRGELVTFLLNYAVERGCSAAPETADLRAYEDYRQVANWCYTGMAWAVHEGIITGMTETTLAPKATANRAQAARMLMKYYEFLNENTPMLSDVEQVIADYVCEKGEHTIGMGEYEYAYKEDGKRFSIEYDTYGYIKFSYKTSPRAGGSPGPASYHEGLSFHMNGLAQEYSYYYSNTTKSYLITSRGSLTPEGFVESEFENKREYPTNEEAYAMRDLAMAELTAFVNKVLDECGLEYEDLFEVK